LPNLIAAWQRGNASAFLQKLLKRLVPAEEGVDLGYEFLLALNGEGLRAALKQGVLFFAGLADHPHARLVALLDKGPDLDVVLLELILDQLQVLIETTF
jgi:hypothetical protein